MEKWKLVYLRYDKITSVAEQGKLPPCLESVPYRDAIRVSSRPRQIFYICEEWCRRHLYWKSWGEGDPTEGPVEEIIQVYEKQWPGKINDIDELIAVEEITDQDLEEIGRLLERAKKALEKR